MKIQIAYKSNGMESFSTRLIEEGVAADYLSGIVLANLLCQQVEETHKDEIENMNVYFDGVYQNTVVSYLS